jgi:NAD dependent epimerase/dehydratase family enzyme
MPFQYIDVLDVANFIVGAIKQDLSGVFNLASDSISRDEFFSIFAKVQGRKIIESDSKNLSDFPLHEHEIFSNIRTISSNLAKSFGLKFTSVQKTLSHY